jgi:hypothetical protein
VVSGEEEESERARERELAPLVDGPVVSVEVRAP